MLKKLCMLAITVSLGFPAIGYAEDGKSVPHRRWSGNRPEEMRQGAERPQPSDFEGLAHKGGPGGERGHGRRGPGPDHPPDTAPSMGERPSEPGMHNVSDDRPAPPSQGGGDGPPGKHRDGRRDYPPNNATPGEMQPGND